VSRSWSSNETIMERAKILIANRGENSGSRDPDMQRAWIEIGGSLLRGRSPCSPRRFWQTNPIYLGRQPPVRVT